LPSTAAALRREPGAGSGIEEDGTPGARAGVGRWRWRRRRQSWWRFGGRETGGGVGKLESEG
jgi:hypothetical protein